MRQFYSHGKLLLTGEYLVLHGALALALPTQRGQLLQVEEISDKKANLTWNSLDDKGNIWFECDFSLPSLQIKSGDGVIAQTLSKILHLAKQKNPLFLDGSHSFTVRTILEFPRNWGLGSSSTLVNNIALWSGADPFDLQFSVFGGSGYDIACASANGPILYRKTGQGPRWEETIYDPPFRDNLYFVYLGQKQNSRTEIARFEQSGVNTEAWVKTLIHLTLKIQQAGSIEDLCHHLDKHEELIATLLKDVPVKKRLFSDFEGSVKSLGAWGGDFVLAATKKNTEWVKDYFSAKDLDICIPYSEMILEKEVK